MDYLHKRLVIDIIGFILTSGVSIGLAFLIRKDNVNIGTILGIVGIALLLFIFDFFNYKKRNNL